ncbi:polysaccharide deacetylase [Lactonifactor longoviformis]|uniref:Polysaccharide deacetylase n=1 Tax=Lactonifactor longoviformis DSM 17459 TaxID=1122155 RepID=A0A1M4Z0A0_9CLOT|nr:polysaccharide deacetylase [Lactonifactor longoviformis]POP30248.1 polysaccharide deacetylase [Lactonifactor longoviformis]SHF11378.1 Polysaccharide deacetylase [Lactonifactor longoviformis DSM 17459]
MSTKKDIKICINPHFDAVSLWIGSWGGEDSPCDISRGVFGAKRGVPRLLDLFKRFNIPVTWGVTGHSMESFPKAADMICDAVNNAGHEIGIHGYVHENPLAMTRQQEADVLDRTISTIEKISGKKPQGYMAPWWELSQNTVELLFERGITYDSSLMEDDYWPYYVRVGDSWTKINYNGPAADWMKPWQPGKAVDLVELPANWHLDDAPPLLFVKASANSHGWITGRQLGEIWQDQFDWVYRNYDYAVLPITIHPDASGKPHGLMMLERLFDHMLSHAGVSFCTMADAAEDFRKRAPFGTDTDLGVENGLHV